VQTEGKREWEGEGKREGEGEGEGGGGDWVRRWWRRCRVRRLCRHKWGWEGALLDDGKGHISARRRQPNCF
jgi:hypothetical protein